MTHTSVAACTILPLITCALILVSKGYSIAATNLGRGLALMCMGFACAIIGGASFALIILDVL
jgi:hypothetical protein